MKQTKLIILLIIFLLGSVLAFRFLRKPQQAKLPVTAVLTLAGDKQQVSRGEELTVTLSLDSKETEVAAADFVIRFDPGFLQAVEVTPGKFFSNYPVLTKNENSVKISAVASFDGESLILPKGKGAVGQIIFRALDKQGSSEIYPDSAKTIVATSGQNILDKNQLNKLAIEVQ